MKRVIFITLLLTTSFLYSQDTVLNKKIDEFTKTTWYTPAKEEIVPNGFYLYFSINEMNKLNPLMISINYHGNDWIFFEKMIVITGGKNYEFEFSKYKRSDDATGRGVYENLDDAVELYRGMVEMLNAILVNDTVKVSLRGKGKNDFVLPVAQVKLIRKYFEAYNKLAKQYGTEIERQEALDPVSPGKLIGIFLFAFVILIGGTIYIVVQNAKKRKMEMALLRRRYEKEVEGRE